MIKLKPATSEELNGFMDESTEFLGELRFRHTFRVDGRLRGRIVSDNTLVVGESARIEADIDCGIVSILGSVVGRVQGRQRIELLAGARVKGTLVAPKLVIEDGAVFEGDCEMAPAAKASPRGADA